MGTFTHVKKCSKMADSPLFLIEIFQEVYIRGFSCDLKVLSSTTKGVVKTRNAGISRNSAEYGGICRNMAEYHDILPEYTGTSQYFPMVAMRLFINMDV
jgi:hypothetical protein